MSGTILLLVFGAIVLRRLPGAWDLTEQHRHSLPPAVVRALRAVGAPVRLVVNLDREDSRRRQIEEDAIAKLRLARPDIQVSFPPDDSRAPAADDHDSGYGRLVVQVGDRSTSTTSSSRREIVIAMLSLVDAPAPDWAQPEYPGYPLVVEGNRRTLILATSYLVLPLLFLIVGLATTTINPRRRTT